MGKQLRDREKHTKALERTSNSINISIKAPSAPLGSPAAIAAAIAGDELVSQDFMRAIMEVQRLSIGDSPSQETKEETEPSPPRRSRRLSGE